MKEFLKEYKELQITEDEAYAQIVNKLMLKNLRGNEKIDNLGEYDSESAFDGKIFISNIYMFTYVAKSPTFYQYENYTIQYTDNLPLVLITGWTPTTIRGINLNLCNKDLKVLILDLFYSMDLNFFENDAERLATGKDFALSKTIYSFLIEKDSENQIKDYLCRAYDGVDYNLIFRNYAVSNIKNIRMIEPWQWKYLPALTYSGSIREDKLKAIHKLSGIDKVKV